MAEVCQEEEENQAGRGEMVKVQEEKIFVDRKLQYVEKEKAPSPSQ